MERRCTEEPITEEGITASNRSQNGLSPRSVLSPSLVPIVMSVSLAGLTRSQGAQAPLRLASLRFFEWE